MRLRRAQQLSLPAPRTWGGRRANAGRRRATRRPTPAHSTRPFHHARHPVHVTLRAHHGLPSLRSLTVFAEIQRAIAAAGKAFFRVVDFSVQIDHVHLLVEADGTLALTRGTQGLAIRCARAINRAVHRRGRVWRHRYHAHYLRTPREVRAARVYVLLNFRKHLRAGPGIDPRSSGRWFDGWVVAPPAPVEPSPVARPQTWLAAVGWRRAGGPIDCRESPAAAPSMAPSSARWRPRQASAQRARASRAPPRITASPETGRPGPACSVPPPRVSG
jgi:REP element-mobilizing transposase RayT